MIGFAEHLDEIRSKNHWWTKADFDITWEQMIHLIDTHPERLYDWNREKQRLGLNEFHTRPSAPQFAKDVVAEMHDLFAEPAPKKEKYDKGHPHVTNIAFCGFGQYSGSYPRHADNMDVFLVQILNECKITIGYTEEPKNADESRMMKPGDAVWLPRGTWHQLEPSVSRVTFSFGFESDPDCDPAYFV
jgi:mannose-6-phosphate isomerase-like protein (cupin superfamily)